ncbi:hydroxyethylthiazole kinase [Afifella marina]|uniref:Hydroxyethylthiazole kinase n=1 Tax=Afifella marina DSM 2698 TaxID=1120955 RepID=A0A1G5N5H0_AFIMA|nr:hydroxyethylthiazole kinase [Afifella marina]SCZ32677.1 hydroxyethylthiazole kinase [Afifella marina DSM 2698]
MPMTIDEVFAALTDLRARQRLVQNITNFVSMSVSANALLALGASPAMVHAEEEVGDFAKLADALVVNIGTLSPAWLRAMKKAAEAMGEQQKPWVLDPVATGATPYRSEAASTLLSLRPTIVRGNASEIMSLAGEAGALGKGVDSLAASDQAIAAAKALARTSGSIVAVTGATDYATDGDEVISVTGGHALMPRSTALGCALSACVAAFSAVRPPLEAATAGLAVYAAAGRIAGERCVNGPGHLPAELCDALFRMDKDLLAAHCGLGTGRGEEE